MGPRRGKVRKFGFQKFHFKSEALDHVIVVYKHVDQLKVQNIPLHLVYIYYF